MVFFNFLSQDLNSSFVNQSSWNDATEWPFFLCDIILNLKYKK